MPLHSAYISKFIFIPNFYSRFFFHSVVHFGFVSLLFKCCKHQLLCCILVTNVCWCFVENLHANDREKKKWGKKNHHFYYSQASAKEYSIQFSHNFICCLFFFLYVDRHFRWKNINAQICLGRNVFVIYVLCVRVCECVCAGLFFFRWLIRKWGTDAMWWFRNVLHFC